MLDVLTLLFLNHVSSKLFTHTDLSMLQQIDGPYTLIDEDPQSRRAPPIARVEKMFERIRDKLPGPPNFILCVLSERKNSDIYGMVSPYSTIPFFTMSVTFFTILLSLSLGPWKKKCLTGEFGIVTQCISPFKVNDQYLTNVLLKINVKVRNLQFYFFYIISLFNLLRASSFCLFSFSLEG